MPADKSFIFNVDIAGPVDAPPVLFHALRAPCACGRALVDSTYTFFPSAVFVHGLCQHCGPQTAIFAPHMRDSQEPLPVVVARSMAQLMASLARNYGESPAVIFDAFLNHLAEVDSATPTTPAA